jgi:hypothetical protein
MKNFKILLMLPLFILAVASCMKDEEPVQYYSALGMIRIKYDSTIIETDLGHRFLAINYELGDDIKNGDRVLAYFSFINQAVPTGIDSTIDIFSIEKIAVKPVFVYDSVSSDSIGNDGIYFNEMNITKDYLNLSFSILGGESIHYVNLARPEGELRTDTIDLEIRHNRNNDPAYQLIDGIISFDLSSLKNDVADSVVLRIKANVYENDGFQRFIAYKYTRTTE